MVHTGESQDNTQQVRVGVLALQGAFLEHVNILSRLPNVTAVLVRRKEHLSTIDALIIPGGESTTIALVAERSGLLNSLKDFVQTKPTWGTCAGLILLANEVNKTKKGGQKVLGGLDIAVNRNQFGSQIDSFEARLHFAHVTTSDTDLFPAVFIRAPIITSINSPDVTVLAKLEHSVGQTDASAVVAVQQGHLLGTAFHPELTDDDRIHRYFVQIVTQILNEKL
ncbi:374_t:CDS:2 [Paraglomus occultum]|uniref:glutaminase n=1 Tax=Paraglomus occultum TaxID=144539 RepID=A0A9N9B4U7_9GLOM|nr:374_t:CDS:2 [Paraglomus occultum]